MNTTSQRPTVFLFDIDGTLLLTGGAGRRAIEAAFALHTGRADACSGFSFGGMTDRAIVRAGLLAVGAAVTDALIDAVIASYLTHLGSEIGQSAGYKVMPGVHETIAALRGHAHCAIGLGTGNVRGGAQIKLRRGELWEHFDFGGFGCDDEDRTQKVGCRHWNRCVTMRSGQLLRSAALWISGLATNARIVRRRMAWSLRSIPEISVMRSSRARNEFR